MIFSMVCLIIHCSLNALDLPGLRSSFDCTVDHLGVLLREGGILAHLLLKVEITRVSMTSRCLLSELLKSFASFVLTVFRCGQL